MPVIVGIDLGTTNSLIGSLDAGFPILITGENGSRLTPSVVSFPTEGGPLVGEPADRLRALRPTETVSSVKRLMGLRAGEIETDDLPYRVGGTPGHPVLIPIHGRDWRPEEISALILKKLCQDAERALGEPVTRAVITVPAYFNDAQRNATKAAGEMAGLVVERILNEPTAAALAYGLDRVGKSRVAVYDLGGGTFDLSILELRDGIFQVVATHGNTRLGGDDIDQILAAQLQKRFEIECGISAMEWENPLNLSRLRAAARRAKIRLSDETSVAVELPFLESGQSPSCEVTRADLEKWSRPLIEKTRQHCLRALEDAKLKPADLDEVILVGGSTRMPLVRAMVEEIFGHAPNLSQNPDEAVAIGATIQAGVLGGQVGNVLLLDVTPLSLGIETFGGLMNVIIPRNTTIPVKAGEMFTNAVASQSSMLIRMLQGERELARDNWTLGDFTIDFPVAARGAARVGVQFEIDANGILHVLARDTKTGAEKIVRVHSAVDVSDAQVETMIAESVEHAFDDMSARVFTEARLKAAEMLPAVQVALERAGSRLEPGERERIESAVREVEQAMEGGVANLLKKAVQELDQATQNLATHLMEQALEDSLRAKGMLD